MPGKIKIEFFRKTNPKRKTGAKFGAFRRPILVENFSNARKFSFEREKTREFRCAPESFENKPVSADFAAGRSFDEFYGETKKSFVYLCRAVCFISVRRARPAGAGGARVS